MQTQTANFLETIDYLEIETLREMKDTLSDFFSSWVVETSRDQQIQPEKQAYHFWQFKQILNSIEKYKTEDALDKKKQHANDFYN